MHWKRFCLVSLSLAWMAFPARVRAQESAPAPGYTAPGYSGPGYSSVDNLSGAMTLTPGGGSYLLFNKQTGQAVGIPSGYSRVGIRHTIFEDGPQQVFGEAHALITDTNRYGLNAGAGYRVMVDEALWGVNGWYDSIQSGQGHDYQQGGVGIEYLSDSLDLRANGYIPFGNRENFLRVTDPGTTPVFVGHDFSTLGTALFQQALEGFDAEAGIPVPVINWLRMYAGFYHLNFDSDQTWGVRSRVEGRLTQGVNLSFQVTNDDKFGTNLNVGVDIRFDGRLPTRFGGSGDAYSRRYDQVRRQWQVQLAENKGDFAVPLNDPTTGDQIAVTWVNNTSGAGGDGTVEHPFNVLPSSADSDYVMVKRGVGDTVGNITLQNGQDLFGEGKQHFINTDRLGLTAVPPAFFANTGTFPTLRAGNPAAPVVTLADGSMVRGFNILGGSTAAIAGTGVDNFLIECVNATSASGVSLVDAGGTGIIRDSNFINTSPTGVGIAVSNTSGPALSLLIDGVTTQGGAVGTAVRAVGAPVTLTMSDYQGTNHTNAGVILEANGSTLGTNITNATLTNVGDGFRFDVASGGALSGSLTQISATGSGNLLEGNVNTGALNLQVSNANLSNSTGGSGVALNLVNATGVAVFDNLTANANAVDGATSLAIGATTNYQLEIHDSSLVGNGNDAVHSTVLGGANMVVIVDPTPATGSGNNGIEFDVDGSASHLTLLSSDTDLSNSGNDAVNGMVTNGARVDIVFDRNPATGSGRNGLNLVVDNGSTLAGIFRDGSFSQSGVGNNGVGINVEVTDNSNVGLTFQNTAAAGNGAVGLAYNVNGGSLLSATFEEGNLSSNPINNVIGTVDGDGTIAILKFDNTNANLLATNGGFAANVTNGASLNSTWNNSNISGTLGDGVRVMGSGNDTQVGLTFNTSLIENNAGNGLVASLTGGNATSLLAVTLNDSTLINNGLDGLNVSVDGLGTTGAVDINSTPITGNGRDGFKYSSTGGARFSTTVNGTGNDFSNNGQNGIDGFVSGAASTAIVSVDGANVNNSGQSGVLLVAQQLGQSQFTLANSSDTGSGSHGVEALAATNGQLVVNLNRVDIQQSQGNGFTFDALTGGDITGSVIGGSLSNNGIGGAFSGVRGNVNGVGSTAKVGFTALPVNNNTLHGFQLNSSAGGQLTATMSSGAVGTLTASNNAGDGIQLDANGAGSISNLLMFGNSEVNGNTGNGLHVTGVDAQQVAVQFSGSIDGNGADGVNVVLNNVNQAALELAPAAGQTIQDNGGDGIQIDLTDTNLTNLNVNGTLVESLKIQGLSILNNGGDGINLHADNSDLTSGTISGNTIQGNGGGGLIVDLVNGSDWNLGVTNNTILDSGSNGIVVTTDSGNSNITIRNNTVAGSLLDNIFVDLSGTSNTVLHIDSNIIDGDGIDPSVTANIVQSFLSPSDNAFTAGEPPDAMGAVGLDHVIELVNDNFRIYDKTTGALVSAMSDEQFWRNVAGANLLGSDVFDHRIIFDTTTNRWIATTITRGNGNQILLAVSATSDPTGVWRSVQWQGDLAGANFNDFDTLGFDSDAVVIGTNDFGAGFSVSVFSIPKADLFGFGAPSIARMTRIQGLAATAAGTAVQPAIDFGPSDSRTAILGVNDLLAASNQVLRTNIIGGTGIGATLSAATAITVPNFNAPSNVLTSNGTTVRADSTRFWGNTVEVNNELWAVHHVAGAGSLNELRWYRIDEATNAVISTGTINAPGLSLFMPSIAVNTAGQIVIGYHASSSTTAPSAYASAGIVQGNNVIFGSPTLLTAGTGEYGGGRWGDYSATVVDPSNPNRFWSILETGRGVTDGVTDFDYGEAFNAIEVSVVAGSTQLTTGSGIRVVASDNAVIAAGSTINLNQVTGHGADGISVDLNGNSQIESLTIDGNNVTNNGGDGIRVTNSGIQTIGSLSVSDNQDVANNGGDGIRIDLTNVSGTPNITVDRNNVLDNGGLGIAIDGIDTSVGVISVQSNAIERNTGGDGLRVNLSSTTGAHVANRVLANSNVVNGNAGDGIEIDLLDYSVTTDIIANNNTVTTNAGRGIFIDILNTDINDVSVSSNIVTSNTGGAGVSVLLDNTTGGVIVADQIVMRNNTIISNSGTGLDVLLNNISNVAEVTVADSSIRNNTGAGYNLTSNNSTINLLRTLDSSFSNNSGGDGAHFGLVDSTVNTFLIDGGGAGDNAGDGVDLDMVNSQIGAASIINMNSSGLTGGNIGLRFLIDGNTFASPWEITNLSDPGILVTGFDLDISTSGNEWNTEEPGGSVPFQPVTATGQVQSSDIVTGLLTVNGTSILQGTSPLQNSAGTVLPDGGVANLQPLLNLTFNDFDPLETFTWDLDVDLAGAGASTVLGSDMIGSLIHVDFTGGLFLEGSLVAVPGSPEASTFVASSGSITTSTGNSNNTGDGVRLSLTNNSSIGSLNIDNNIIGGNDRNGIEFLVSDSTLPALPDRINISNNTITGQTLSGVRMVLPDTNGNSFGVDFVNNTISNNAGGPGIDLQLDDNAGSNFEASFTGNTINSNGAQGVNFAISQNVVADLNDFSGNTVNGNGGVGLRINATDNSQFALAMGATGHNTFNANADAGLGVTMNSNTQGQLTVLDSQFDNTTNGPDATFSGEGIHIQLQDNAVLPNLVIGDPAFGTSTATGNASHGIQIFVDGFSQLTNPTIQNMTINTNGGDGINIERRGIGVIDNFVINGNRLNQNGGDGFDIQARAGNLTDEYTITNNTINGSTGRGIAFRVDGDADMITNLDGNAITNSGGTGITVNSTVNAVTDTPTFVGTWLASTITGNGGRGVDIQSPGHIIQIGDATAAFPDTIISNNAQQGVFVGSLGTLDLDNVQINGNGADGVLFQGGTGGLLTIDRAEISQNLGDGVDLEMTGNTLSVTNSRIAQNRLDGVRVNSVAGVNNVTLTNNIMTLNTQDGLEIINNSAAGLTATITNSQFTSNIERGVAIINRGNGQANVTLDDNQVVSNGEEGVYVVNTASVDQNSRANATVALSSNGLVTANPDLVFAMNRNTVSANGLSSAFTATGLVMRVGTADGGLADFTNDGGFAATRAGVTATVQDNTLQGNAGSDVYFESFVSTGNPLTSVGTWDGATFSLTQYQTDPLARLDLVYGNNVADSTQATNIGASYNNAEAEFKSRLTSQTPGGPFTSSTRDRNAQRLADRDVAAGGALLAPNVPVVQPSYLYSGVGASTFRVQLNPGNVFGTGNGFILDNAPYIDVNDANGVGPAFLFGWGTLP